MNKSSTMKQITNNSSLTSIGFTPEAFKKWLTKQPLDRHFDYTDNQACVFASFIKEHLDYSNVDVVPECAEIDGFRFKFNKWFCKLDNKISSFLDKNENDFIHVSEICELLNSEE